MCHFADMGRDGSPSDLLAPAGGMDDEEEEREDESEEDIDVTEDCQPGFR